MTVETVDYPCGIYKWTMERLSSMQVTVIEERSKGRTLESIAEDIGLTRERIRQIEKSAFDSLEQALTKSDLSKVIRETFEHDVIVNIDEIDCLGVIPRGLAYVYVKYFRLKILDITPQRFVYKGEPPWVKQIQSQAPISIEIAEAIVGATIDEHFAQVVAILTGTNHHPEYGFYGGKTSDLYYLFLQKKGSQSSIQELCQVFEETDRNVLAKVDRDDRIVRHFTDKSVVLAEWPEARSVVNSAKEALLLVLEQNGPLAQVQLIRKAQAIYSRTAGRYAQVLDDPIFGRTSDGRIDLLANGAKPREIKEPKRHRSIKEYENGLATIDLKVDKELLRGAGPQAPKRLAWLMGLNKPEDYIDFVGGYPNHLRLKFFTSGVSFSSLRLISEEMGLQNGCEIQVALDRNNKRFGVRPNCDCHTVQDSSKS